MDIYLQQNGQQSGPFTEDQLRESVDSGAINQFDLAIHAGLTDWQPLCTIINVGTAPTANQQAQQTTSGTPHLQPPTSGTPHLQPPTSGTQHLPPPTFGTPQSQSAPPSPNFTLPSTSSSGSATSIIQSLLQRSSVIGGWICFDIGFIVLIAFSWPFYIHYALFVAALIFSIEALWQHRIIGGLSLLVTTLILPTIVGFSLLIYRANQDIEPESDDSVKISTEQKIEQ